MIDLDAARLLGRHIGGGAHDRPGIRRLQLPRRVFRSGNIAPSVGQFSQSEIEDFDESAIEDTTFGEPIDPDAAHAQRSSGERHMILTEGGDPDAVGD